MIWATSAPCLAGLADVYRKSLATIQADARGNGRGTWWLSSSNKRSRSQYEMSACSLDRPHHGGGASLRAIPNANQRSGLDNDRNPKGRPCFERNQAELWWSANGREAGHAKRRKGAHTSTSPLNLTPVSLRLAFDGAGGRRARSL